MSQAITNPSDALPPEKGVPLPPRRGGGQPYGVLWGRFEVGDSVFLAGYRQGRGKSDQGDAKMSNLNLSYIRRAAPLAKFTARMTTKDGVPGVRVWRVE